MNELYEALEVCLNEIEQGADVETVLFRYPELAADLRPILEASVKAREMAAPAPAQDVVRRNRAKFLQYASEMRERKAAPISRRIWFVPLRRALVTLMVVTLLFISGTGLVRASSNTLPGDNLYPVKRTWEDMLVFFTFNPIDREALELEHENERLDELHELFAEGRSVEVDFAGYVTWQTGSEWRVSGITVVLLPETRMPDQPVNIGDAVRIHGHIQSYNVAAIWIELLPSGSRLPEVEDGESEIEEEGHEGSSQTVVEATAIVSENEAPKVTVTVASGDASTQEKVEVEGVVTSVENNFIVVDDTVLDIQFAEVEGTPSVGAVVKAEGYFDPSGILIVTKIEIKDDGVDVGETGSNDNVSNTNSNSKTNDNTNDDNTNDDHHDNDNDN